MINLEELNTRNRLEDNPIDTSSSGNLTPKLIVLQCFFKI